MLSSMQVLYPEVCAGPAIPFPSKHVKSMVRSHEAGDAVRFRNHDGNSGTMIQQHRGAFQELGRRISGTSKAHFRNLPGTDLLCVRAGLVSRLHLLPAMFRLKHSQNGRCHLSSLLFLPLCRGDVGVFPLECL